MQATEMSEIPAADAIASDASVFIVSNGAVARISLAKLKAALNALNP